MLSSPSLLSSQRKHEHRDDYAFYRGLISWYVFYRFYKSLRSDLLIPAFKEDSVMIEAAELALTTLMHLPLKFGAMCTEARKEVWRFTRTWPRMLADHINSILTKPGPRKSEDDISDALNLIALMPNKIAFANHHKRHLANRILGHWIGFDKELERFVVEDLVRLGYPSELLRPISTLLEDCSSFRIEEVGGTLYCNRQGGRGRFDLWFANLKAPPFELDFDYLSESVWRECGVW
jgi:hypothetical protein